MPERTSYTQGTPNWVDLPTSDQAAAKAFYAGLFGWTYDDQPMGAEGEGQVYSMAVLNGHQVAAISSQPAEMAAAGAPPMWNTYLAVDSADEATAKVEAAGGKVAMAPFDVMDAGRMSFVMDPSGAPVALWQANRHIGATLVNEPGTVTWNELITTDPGVVSFYADVLSKESKTITANLAGKFALRDGWYTVQVRHQPTLNPDRVHVSVDVPKGWRIDKAPGMSCPSRAGRRCRSSS